MSTKRLVFEFSSEVEQFGTIIHLGHKQWREKNIFFLFLTGLFLGLINVKMCFEIFQKKEIFIYKYD